MLTLTILKQAREERKSEGERREEVRKKNEGKGWIVEKMERKRERYGKRGGKM